MNKRVAVVFAAVLMGVGVVVRGQYVDEGKGGVPPMLASNEDMPGPGMDQREGMARELMRLRAERGELAARFGAQSVELVPLDKAIVEIRQRLAAASELRLAGGTGDEPAGLAGMATVPVFPRIVQMEPEAPAAVAANEPAASAPPTPSASPTDENVPAASSFEESAEDRAARTALAKNLVSLVADKRELFKVIASIREQAKVNVDVNWKALQAAGIDQNTPVSLNLNQVTAEKALKMVLAEVGGGTANLDFTIDGGSAVVSTRDDLNSAKYQSVRIYDVRDLLAIQPMYPYLQQMAGQAYENGVTNLTDAIKAMVAPDSWRDNGGQIGSIRELNGQLVINQSKDNQREIAQFLVRLRASYRRGN